jgi:flagellar biosynthesis regulator FlaF
MKTTKEIHMLYDDKKLWIQNNDEIQDDTKWFSVSDVEQLQKQLKEELRCNLPSNFDCDKESERIVDEVFNNFKGGI